MNLEELTQKIEQSSQNGAKLPREKHITVALPEKIEHIDICVLSNIQVGLTGAQMHTSKEDKPFRINKLKAHIAELAKNPNARVVLGGDLFYFPMGSFADRKLYSPSYEDQVQIMAELLEPIKNKIVAAYAGTDEIKIFEKDQIDITKYLMETLGMPERYCGQMAEVDFIFKNQLTNGTARVVNMLFDHGFLVANALSTVAKKTTDLQQKINGKDFYFTSHYNKLFIKKSAVLKADHGTHMLKVPCYFVSVGGYRDFANRLTSNRNTSPANTNNGMIRVFVAPNPDRNNIRGHDYIGEPQYKVCQEFVNFGRTKPHEFNFDLIEEISKLTEENILNRDLILQKISQKIDEINNANMLGLLTQSYYKEQDAAAKSEIIKISKNLTKTTRPLVIDETKQDEGEEKC